MEAIDVLLYRRNIVQNLHLQCLSQSDFDKRICTRRAEYNTVVASYTVVEYREYIYLTRSRDRAYRLMHIDILT